MDRPTPLRLLAQVCLIAVAACLNGCCCCDDTEVVARVDSPVPAELIHTRRWVAAGGRGSLIPYVPRNEAYVSILTSPPSRFSACYEPEPELVSDATGARFAHRCDKDASWEMAFAGTGGRAIVARNPGLGAGKAPDWARAVSFEQAALDIVKINGISTPLFEESRARGGDHAAAVLLVAFKGGYEQDSLAPWEEQYEKLPADEKSFVLAQLALRLQTSQPSAGDALLFAGWAPADEPTLALLRTFENRLGKGDEPTDLVRSVVVLSALRNAGTHPEEAGQLACRAFEKWIRVFTADARSPSYTTQDEKLVLLILARTGVRCKAVEEKLEPPTCRDLMNCAPEGERFRACAKQELEAKVRQDWETLEGKAGASRWTGFNLGELRLAVRYLGPLPEDLEAVVRRSNYVIIEPATPPCEAPDTPVDAPCECFKDWSHLQDALCFAPPPPANAEGKTFKCRFRIDDVGRKIFVLGKTIAALSPSSASPAEPPPPPAVSASSASPAEEPPGVDASP